MKFKILTLVVMLFLIAVINTSGQETLKRNPHGIGLNIGSFSGGGLTYNYFPKKFGFQTNVFIVNETYQNGFNFMGIIGGSMMYSVQRKEHFNIFFHLTNSYWYERSKSESPYDGHVFHYDAGQYQIGTGPGLEIYSEHFSWTFFYGFGFYNNFETFFTLGGGVSFLILL
jgi:hypothetical protein